MTPAVSVTLPLRLVSVANRREHWAARARRARLHRHTAAMAVTAVLRRRRMSRGGRYIITITRIGRRKMDDDNLAAACKAVRDGIADAIGMDDGADEISWRYGQERGDYAVRVDIAEC